MCARRSSRKKWIIYGVILLAAASLGGILFFRPAPLLYESVVAESGDITTYYSFSGNVETKNRQTVMAENMIQVSEIKVKEGQKINSGAVLLSTTTKKDLKAEISGEIVNLHVEENAQVMAGTPILEIVDYDNLRVQVKVDEYDITSFAKGNPATVKISALNKEFQGKISDIAKEGQIMNGVTFFPATIDLPKDTGIKVGMSAEVKLISSQVSGVVALPMYVIQFNERNQPYIFKKDANGAVVKNDITTGINDGSRVEIQSGVAPGETIYYKKSVRAEGMGFTRSGTYENAPNGNHPGIDHPGSLSGSMAGDRR